ncbi:MAG: DUF262 domain-containing protein [Muribaculum sp.]|nr:DUF262 domain-containing protein [Muribaculum sp.]
MSNYKSQVEKTSTIRFINLYSLFSRDFLKGECHILLIPGYQRGFKWAVKPDEEMSSVEYFTHSLVNNSKNSREDFFLQGITVYENGNTIEIVDGQQRITTLYLLLWCLGKENISETTLKYESRCDTEDLLGSLKSIDPKAFDAQIIDCDSQDTTFIKQGIHQINDILKQDVNIQDLLEFIKHKIKVIYVPIRKEKIVSTFTMMNGAKAVMRDEELVKAEMLKRVSQIMNTPTINFENLDSAFEEIRRYSALDWKTAMLRSQYARDWDKWLQWWYQPEVIKFFSFTKRPMGLLLNTLLRDLEKEHTSEDVNFREFCEKVLKDNNVTVVFEDLRKLQKKFEDLYNDSAIYNYLGTAIKCTDNKSRYDVIKIFRERINDVEYLRRFVARLVYGCPLDDAKDFTRDITVTKQNFNNAILNKFVYNQHDREAFRLLLWLNVLQDVKLQRKFNFNIAESKSLEHIHPKSKVYHEEEIDGLKEYLTGAGDDAPFNGTLPEGVIMRSDIENYAEKEVGAKLTEHSISNLVLLYKRDNSEFNNKSFAEKKLILFNMDVQTPKELKRIFESRSLIHTMSKFAKSDWTPADMIEYYNEVKGILEKGLEND